MVQMGLMKPGETMTRVDTPAPPVSAVGGREGGSGGGGGGTALQDAADKEAAFALEMQIQIKRAEREKKRQVCMRMLVLLLAFVPAFVGWTRTFRKQ